MNIFLLFLAMLVASLLLDAVVRPRRSRLRSARGICLQMLIVTAVFALGLTVFGSPPVAAAIGVICVGVLVIGSNAKNRMLGEPLVFSDLALLGAMVRHPQFYFTAFPLVQRVLFGFGAIGVTIALAASFETQLRLHFIGLVLLAGTCGLLWLWRGWFGGIARTPDLHADVLRNGLIPTLLLYWWRWRRTNDPPSAPVLPAVSASKRGFTSRIIVIVQCESFADPIDLITSLPELPGLAAARAAAWQYGDLLVSGFGAYTMRTEYGVLFGRQEEDLGFRRYDPFLTAFGETSYALPARLAQYRSIFVHPHNLRFYARDRLMPASGFDAMIGEDDFAAHAGRGRYIDDRTLGRRLAGLVDEATDPTVLYAVTMENHGPWDGSPSHTGCGRLDSYLRHLRNSDAMLAELSAHLAEDGRPALLVFFGDHRPSIPGITAPGGPRHTPYVMLQFGPGAWPGPGRVDLTPAGLHQAILASVAADSACPVNPSSPPTAA